jgi:hypothetical protein
VIQLLRLCAHPARGSVADGQEPGREIVPLQSGQTLIDSSRHGLSLGLTCKLRESLDRFVDRRILNVQSQMVPFYL